MDESVDVVVVGARCSGSPLAALLARRGLTVVVLERAVFPRDTLSSHVFQADALAFLDRLGVADQIRATGAYFMRRARSRMNDLEFTATWPQQAGDIGGGGAGWRVVRGSVVGGAA